MKAQLSMKEVMALCYRFGFYGSSLGADTVPCKTGPLCLATATAIALSESSGRPGAEGDGGDSIGLFQINIPAHKTKPWWPGAPALKDPINNVKAAVQVMQDTSPDDSRKASFRPWSVFTSGRYLAHMPGTLAMAQKDFVQGSTESDIDAIIDGIYQGTKRVGEEIADATGLATVWDFLNWVTERKNWLRIFFIVMGAFLFLYALYRLTKELEVKPPALIMAPSRGVGKLVGRSKRGARATASPPPAPKSASAAPKPAAIATPRPVPTPPKSTIIIPGRN